MLTTRISMCFTMGGTGYSTNNAVLREGAPAPSTTVRARPAFTRPSRFPQWIHLLYVARVHGRAGQRPSAVVPWPGQGAKAKASAAAEEVELAVDVKLILTPPCIFQVAIIYRKNTGWRENNFNVHG